jgi:hypothetical protein
MAAKSEYYETGLLLLIFNAVDFATFADNTSSGPLTDLWVSLCTASPAAGGDQETNEAAYTSYARVSVARDATGWTVSGGTVNPLVPVTFPTATGAGDDETETHWAVGTDASGPGNLLYFGPITPSIPVIIGVTPELTVATNVTED